MRLIRIHPARNADLDLFSSTCEAANVSLHDGDQEYSPYGYSATQRNDLVHVMSITRDDVAAILILSNLCCFNRRILESTSSPRKLALVNILSTSLRGNISDKLTKNILDKKYPKT